MHKANPCWTLGDQDYPPDGAWGWVVTFGCFVAHIHVVGQQYAYGFMYQAFLDEDQFSNDSNSASAAAVGGIASANMYLFGLLAGILVRRYSTRAVALLGCALMLSGLLLSSTVSTFWLLYLTYSGIVGMGYSMTYSASLIAVNSFFTKKRPLASGVAVCGSGVGTVLYAFLCSNLISKVGWRQTMQIMAVLSAVTTALACLSYGTVRHASAAEAHAAKESSKASKPMAVELQRVCVEDSENLLEQDACRDVNAPSEAGLNVSDTALHSSEGEGNGSAKNETATAFAEICNNSAFLPLMLIMFTFSIALWIPYTFLVEFAQDVGHFPPERTSILVSMMGISSTAGRILIGFAGVYISTEILLQISMTFSGLAMMALAVLPSSSLVIFGAAIVFGAFSGSITALQGPILVDQFGMKRLPLALGLSSFMKVPGTALGPTLGGLLLLLTGSYYMTWFIPGFIMCVVSVCLFKVPRSGG